MIKLFNEDCMDAMREMKDKAFELAIVDPPVGKYKFDSLINNKPQQEYFDELQRVSKHQIVWGGNNFIQYLSNTSCFIVWDKDNTGHFADCELAWTSFKTATRKYTFRWNGMLQGNMKNKEFRIHPTQKPVALYKWLLQNYAKPGDKILDTHLGSASSAIAAYDMNFDFTGYEIDAEYFAAAKGRVEKHILIPSKQGKLFDEEPGITTYKKNKKLIDTGDLQFY